MRLINPTTSLNNFTATCDRPQEKYTISYVTGDMLRCRVNRTVTLTIMIILTLLITSTAGAGTTLPASTVATVNGTIIGRVELDREFKNVQQRLSSQGRHLNESQLSNLKETVLKNLIDRELLYQESEKQGITIKPEEVDKELDSIKKRFPNDEEFKKAMNGMNISEADLKFQIKRGMSVQKFVDDNFMAKINVSETEAKAFYDETPGIFEQPEQVRASHILIKVAPDADEDTKAKARDQIEDIQKKLNDGEDFAELAKKESQGPSSVKGGDLGFFARGQMVKPFEDASFYLKPGEISNVVETRFGYHLIKVTDKKPATKIPFDEIKDQIIENKKQEQLQHDVAAFVENLKKTAKIEKFLEETAPATDKEPHKPASEK